MTERLEVPQEDPDGALELALIQQYLRDHGKDLSILPGLPTADRELLLHDASIYAAGKLAEIEARAHYVEDLHQHE